MPSAAFMSIPLLAGVEFTVGRRRACGEDAREGLTTAFGLRSRDERAS